MLKKLCIKFFILILKIIYFPIKHLKVQRKVVYISRQFNKGTLDFNLIVKSMEEEYPDVKNVVLAKRMEKSIISKIGYFFHMIVQMYHVATAKVVITDSYCIVISVLNHKKETKIIQTWHAISAIKKFGYQTIGKKSGTDKVMADAMCMHKNYDYVLCASKITKKYFMEAFNIKEENIKTTISFDFIITLTTNRKYQTNIQIDIPAKEVIEKGVDGIELTEFNNLIFKRIEN